MRLMMGLSFLVAGSALVLTAAVLPTSTSTPLARQPFYASDYYRIMDEDDRAAYDERMKDIIFHGVDDIRARRAARKGTLQKVAEDWEWMPGGFRSWLKQINGDFARVVERRRQRAEVQAGRLQARLQAAMEKKGLFLSYFMYNTDGDATGGANKPKFQMPNLRLVVPHTPEQVKEYLVALRGRKFNHLYVGLTQEFQPYGNRRVDKWLVDKGYEGFRFRQCRVVLGKGPEVYKEAKKKMVLWELNDPVQWCQFLEGEHGINLVSRIRCYKLFWTLNPLRKVLCHEKPMPGGGAVSAVAVSTLKGHLLEGEERFSVTYEGEGGDVYFDMLSFSRGAAPLGKLLMPLIRPLQRRFFLDLGAAMKDAVKPHAILDQQHHHIA